ncbi:MAG TPA: helix-turn-helix domain-containing protein [Jiangellaceae bacterium]
MDNAPRSDCPINAAVELLGDKWSLLILRDMVFGGSCQFRQLQSGLKEGIASNILTDRLRRLVDAGLLTKHERGRGRPTTYRLAEPAIQLVPVLVTLGAWGARHRPTTPELRRGAEEMEAGGPEHWQQLMAELRERVRNGEPE